MSSVQKTMAVIYKTFKQVKGKISNIYRPRQAVSWVSVFVSFIKQALRLILQWPEYPLESYKEGLPHLKTITELFKDHGTQGILPVTVPGAVIANLVKPFAFLIDQGRDISLLFATTEPICFGPYGLHSLMDPLKDTIAYLQGSNDSSTEMLEAVTSLEKLVDSILIAVSHFRRITHRSLFDPAEVTDFHCALTAADSLLSVRNSYLFF